LYCAFIIGNELQPKAKDLPMPAYRIYTIGNDGYFSSAPAFVESTDDKAAIENAMQGKIVSP
jgi:hypothetical protein